MKCHRLPILFMAVAASVGGTASAASFSYQGLTYNDANCSNGFTMDASGNISCSTAAAPAPTSVPVCNAIQNQSVAQGASVTLTASCSNSPSSYNWMLNGSTIAAAQSYTTSSTLAQGTYTVSLTATNGVGTSTPQTATLNVTAPTTNPPPTEGDALCTQANLSNTVMPLDWTPGTYKDIHINQNQSVSFPLMITTASSGGRFTMSYTSGGTEIISISQNKCDFSPTLVSSGCLTGGTQPNMTFQTPGSPYSNCTLTPGVQYYVNVRNAVMATRYTPQFPIVDSCTSGKCFGTMSFNY